MLTNKSLLSTNLIENTIHNHRRGTNLVSRWRHAGSQVERWAAPARMSRLVSGIYPLVHLAGIDSDASLPFIIRQPI